MCPLPSLPRRPARPIKASGAAQRWGKNGTCAPQFGTLIQLGTVSTPAAAAGRTGPLPEVWPSNWSPRRSTAGFSARLASSKPWNIESKHTGGSDKSGIDIGAKPHPTPHGRWLPHQLVMLATSLGNASRVGTTPPHSLLLQALGRRKPITGRVTSINGSSNSLNLVAAFLFSTLSVQLIDLTLITWGWGASVSDAKNQLRLPRFLLQL